MACTLSFGLFQYIYNFLPLQHIPINLIIIWILPPPSLFDPWMPHQLIQMNLHSPNYTATEFLLHPLSALKYFPSLSLTLQSCQRKHFGHCWSYSQGEWYQHQKWRRVLGRSEVGHYGSGDWSSICYRTYQVWSDPNWRGCPLWHLGGISHSMLPSKCCSELDQDFQCRWNCVICCWTSCSELVQTYVHLFIL